MATDQVIDETSPAASPGTPDELEAVVGEGLGGVSEAAKAVLFGLQSQSHLYAGTVPDEVVRARRAKNRAARRARTGNTAALRRQARRQIADRRKFRRGQAPWLPGISQDRVVDAEVVEDDQ